METEMDIEGKKIKGRNLAGKLIISAFCILIVAIMAYVLFFDYEPQQNSVNALSSVVMDILCILILVKLTGCIIFGKYELNQTTKLYVALLIATIWALFLDYLNWAYDGSLSFEDITYWYTIGSLCMGSLLACLFTQYLYSYMVRTHDLYELHFVARICAIVDVISFFVTFTLAITRTAFSFVDGHYQVGFLYDIVTLIPILSVIVLTLTAARYVRKVGVHDVLSAVGYFLYMIIGALIEGEFGIGTTYVSMAMANLFIFVMLQNEVISLEKRNVEKWIHKSYTDELTNFFNRHAYENELTLIEGEPLKESFTYVSIDVNGLKSVNDTLGHMAGDELLIGAAECMKQSFGAYGKLFRIGGDEFAALLYTDETQLTNLQSDIHEVSSKWIGKSGQKLTMACGYVTAAEGQQSVRQMAIIADKRMYEAKAKYYQDNGIERRKNRT